MSEPSPPPSVDETPAPPARARTRVSRWPPIAAIVAIVPVALLVAAALAERVLDVAFPFPIADLHRLGESVRVEAADGTWLRVAPTAAGERLLRVPLSEISPHVIHALLAAEDRRFFEHDGVDWAAAVRATLTNLEGGRIISGASTLTMQLARVIEPRTRSYAGKLAQAFRARQLERLIPKQRILEEYLNNVPFGGTLRGIEAAARYWFDQKARDLDAAEAATLIALLPAPTRRSPAHQDNGLEAYRNAVLDHMLEQGYLTSAEHADARAAPMHASPHPWPYLAPHFGNLALRGASGPIVHTDLDPVLQRELEAQVDAQDMGVDGVAVVVLARRGGAIRALVGARSWRQSKVNAATARRAAGSTLKPFLYALAVTDGVVSLSESLPDLPMRFGDWQPRNFDEEFHGAVRAATALQQSRNIPAVELLRRLGVDRFREVLVALGLPARDQRLDLDVALGSLEVSPLEIARAYVKFCAVAETPLPPLSDASREAVLRALAEHGPLPGQVDASAVAWKTGTSSGRRDAWCVAITATHVAVAWLGNLDGSAHANLVGARSAVRLLCPVP